MCEKSFVQLTDNCNDRPHNFLLRQKISLLIRPFSFFLGISLENFQWWGATEKRVIILVRTLPWDKWQPKYCTGGQPGL